MNIAAKQIYPLSGDRLAIDIGYIDDQEEDVFLVQNSHLNRFRAEKARSLLLTPGKGDKVLFTTERETGKSYILTVLESASDAPHTLTVDGDLELESTTGNLCLRAKRGVSILSPESVEIATDNLGLAARTCEMAAPSLSLFGDTLRANVSKIDFFSDRLTSVVGRLVGKYRSRASHVEGLDETSAGVIKQTAKSILSLRAKFSFMRAEKNVKIDGKQILMG